jgi:hypothetical protein
MGGTCSRVGDRKNAYTVLVGRPEGRRQLGMPRRRKKGKGKVVPVL